MKIIMTDKADGSKKEVTLEETIDKTEGSGFWKKGTVKQMLEEGQTVWTAFAIYEPVED